MYGVGAVGHQSCAACGAKWRYLWQEPESIVRRSRRPLAIVAGLVLLAAVGGVVAVAASGGSSKKFAAATATSTSFSTTSAPGVAATAPPAGSGAGATGADFERIFRPANAAKTDFMRWLATDARSTGQYDVNQKVAGFVHDGRAAEAALEQLQWPEAAAGDVAKLERSYRTFLDDADQLRYGLQFSTSFSDRLRSESQAVKDDATVVRHDLGLDPNP